jgi:hypothetical protein
MDDRTETTRMDPLVDLQVTKKEPRRKGAPAGVLLDNKPAEGLALSRLIRADGAIVPSPASRNQTSPMRCESVRPDSGGPSEKLLHGGGVLSATPHKTGFILYGIDSGDWPTTRVPDNSPMHCESRPRASLSLSGRETRSIGTIAQRNAP